MPRPREFDEDVALDSAMQVFWQRGYREAGIQDLCDAMALNPGSVYGAYGSKHGLYIAVVRRYLDKVSRDGIQQIASAPTGIDGIRTYFDYVVESIVNGDRRWGCLGTNAIVERGEHDRTIEKLMNAHFLALEAAFRQALEREWCTGNGEPVRADDARFLVCVAQGLNVLARASPSRETLVAIVDKAIGSIAAARGQH